MSSRLVIDTNVLVSAALSGQGQSWRVVAHVLTDGVPLFSASTFAELVEVLNRPKLQRYLKAARKDEFVSELRSAAVWVEPAEPIRACRDPKDDQFLEVAITGRANFLVTGDKDLLVLHPFRGVPILTPAAFLAETDI